jgi:hypothetical protein
MSGQTAQVCALKASWCYIAHCTINWQVIFLEDLGLPLDKVHQTGTNFITYVKAKSGKARLSRYCEDGSEHSYCFTENECLGETCV